MEYKQLRTIFFSPNGTTERAVQGVAEGMGLPAVSHDLTPFAARWEKIKLQEDEIAVIALPVYGGRLPGICREFFRGIHGGGAPAVILVTYGNNMYGDALSELKERAEKAGFRPVAAAAVPTEHCMNPKICPGRPDQEDMVALRGFGGRVKELLLGWEGTIPPLTVPGKPYPYEYRIFDKRVAPQSDESCTKCGTCARGCPVMAINPLRTEETDVTRCLLCMKCVYACPSGARKLTDEKMNEGLTLIEKMNREPKKQAYFYTGVE